MVRVNNYVNFDEYIHVYSNNKVQGGYQIHIHIQLTCIQLLLVQQQEQIGA